MFEQKGEQVELSHGEAEQRPALQDPARRHIEMELASLHRRLRCEIYNGAAQDRLHPKHKFPRRKRLGEVIISPSLEPVDAILLFPQRSEHDDRDSSLGADASAHLDTIDSGKHAVENYKVRAGSPGDLYGREPVAGPVDNESRGTQVAADDL